MEQNTGGRTDLFLFDCLAFALAVITLIIISLVLP